MRWAGSNLAGINHVRFHTWTPPEAAFEAAEQLGVHLQPELPFWGEYQAAQRDGSMPECRSIGFVDPRHRYRVLVAPVLVG